MLKHNPGWRILSGLFVLFLFIGSFGGCRTAGGDVVYSGLPDFDRCDTVCSVVLAADLELNFPKQMFVIDTVIGIVDANAAHDYYVHLFSEQGKLLGRVGKIGRGPGEMTDFCECFVNERNKTISFFCQTKVIEYNLEQFFSGHAIYYRDREVPKVEDCILHNAFWLDKDRFFSWGSDEGRRFSIQESDNQIICRYYPVVVDNPEYNRAVFGSYTVMGFNKKLDHFVQGTYIGGILDIFRIEAEQIVPQQTVYFYKPVFELVRNAPSHISWGDETTIGFHALVCSDRYIYTLLNGVKGAAFKAVDAVFDPPYPSRISIFDWSGLPVRSITLDEKLMAIAVRGDTTAYLVSSNRGYSLVKVPL